MDLNSSTIQIILFIVFLSACLLAWFQCIGFLICRVLRLDDKNHSFIGVIFTSISGVYLAYLGPTSNVVYMVPVLIGLLFFACIGSFSKKDSIHHLRRSAREVGKTIVKRNLKTYGCFLLFSLLSLAVFVKEIKGSPPGIISLGNVDPINYGLVSRNMSENGFEATDSFANVDLAKQAKFDWTGTMSFLASIYSIGKSFNIDIGFYHLVVIAFLISYFCLGLIQVSNRIYPVQRKIGKVFQILLVIILVSSQLNQYIIGNGFFAQMVFTSMLPHGLMLIWDYRKIQEFTERRTKSIANHLTSGLVLGTLILFYAPLGLLFFGIPMILIAIVLLDGYKRSSNGPTKVHFAGFFSYFLGITIGLVPLVGYLQVANSKLLVSGSASMPGWRIENFNLLNLLPGQILCLPGEGNCANATLPALGIGLIFVLSILIIKGFSSKSVYLLPISKTPAFIFIAYSFLLLLYFLSRYGLSAYPTWKFLSFVQILAFLVFLPVLLRGIDGFTFTERKVKKKVEVKTRKIQFTLLISILTFYASLSLVQTSELHKRSGFSYVTPKWIADLTSLNRMNYLDGLNIELDGYNGMLAAYYLPVESRAITQTSGYYSGIPRVFPLTLTNSTSIYNGKILAELNTTPPLRIVE